MSSTTSRTIMMLIAVYCQCAAEFFHNAAILVSQTQQEAKPKKQPRQDAMGPRPKRKKKVIGFQPSEIKRKENNEQEQQINRNRR